jgi:hypothetical protein
MRRTTLQLDDLVAGDRYWVTFEWAGQPGCNETFLGTFDEFQGAHRGLMWCVFLDSRGDKQAISSRAIKVIEPHAAHEGSSREPPAAGDVAEDD